MENLRLDKVKLMQLKRLLPHGSIGEIAEQLGIHRNNVTDVFKGKWENQEVIDLAIQKIEDKKLKVAEIESRIDQALSK